MQRLAMCTGDGVYRQFIK